MTKKKSGGSTGNSQGKTRTLNEGVKSSEQPTSQQKPPPPPRKTKK